MLGGGRRGVRRRRMSGKQEKLGVLRMCWEELGGRSRLFL